MLQNIAHGCGIHIATSLSIPPCELPSICPTRLQVPRANEFISYPNDIKKQKIYIVEHSPQSLMCYHETIMCQKITVKNVFFLRILCLGEAGTSICCMLTRSSRRSLISVAYLDYCCYGGMCRLVASIKAYIRSQLLQTPTLVGYTGTLASRKASTSLQQRPSQGVSCYGGPTKPTSTLNRLIVISYAKYSRLIATNLIAAIKVYADLQLLHGLMQSDSYLIDLQMYSQDLHSLSIAIPAWTG